MKRILATAPCLLAALVLAPAADAAKRAPVPVTARLSVCHRAVDPAARSVGADAVMRPVHGTSQMGIRFDLRRRGAGAPSYSSVPGPLLGNWNRSPRGVQRFHYVKRVENLSGPARYRFAVSFRWYDRHGHVLKTVHRRTKTCFQPELRPDLRFLGTIRATPVPDHPRQTRYEADVKNAGGTPTGAFDVAFSFTGTAGRTKAVRSIAPGGIGIVRFTGPACTEGTTIAFALDPDLAVPESDETNNSLTVTCSASAPAP